MLRLNSIKARLFFLVVLSALTLASFATLVVYSTRNGSRVLSQVYEEQVEPTAALLQLDNALKEVRFRMAGYLLDQMPAVGNRLQLAEARALVPLAWSNFRDKTKKHEFADGAQALIMVINQNIDAFDAMATKLDRAYAREDRAAITGLLEDEWPVTVHATLLKPVAQLIPSQQAAVKDAYEESLAFGERMVANGIVLLGTITLILVVLSARLTQGITRSLNSAAVMADEIAEGGLNHGIDTDTHDEVGQLLQHLVQMQDKVVTREQRLKTILDNAAEGIITFDSNGVIDGFNQAAEHLFGYAEGEVAGENISLLIAPSLASENRQDYLEHLMRTEIERLIGHEGEVTGRHKSGDTFPMALKISKMLLQGHRHYTALAADISERKALIDNLKRLAEHDGLTGLYNRSYFIEELERVVERIRRGDRGGALLYIDLDNFKYVNDTLGHAAGDLLLIEVSNILKKRARKSDVITRLGGDEFTVLLYNITPEQARQVAESYRRTLAEHHFMRGHERVDIGCSIGLSLIDTPTLSASQALARADIACHLAKRGGRNRVHTYNPADQENVDAMSLDMGWSRRIKHAIEHDRFVLVYQPILVTGTGAVASYEVLLRMRDENGGLIMPGGFLPSAERFGLASAIDRWVIVHAIRDLASQRRSLPHLRYSINLSGQSLSDQSICDLIHDQIDESGVDPGSLLFEITETVAIADMATASNFLSRIRALGCLTALDDFGSGMSSFAYLRDLPVNCIKIDGRFVKNMAENDVDQAMVRAMNEIAHTLGKQTVAEFVEDEASLKLLTSMGVDFVQGYHLGRPEAILQERQPRDRPVRRNTRVV